MMWMVLDGVEDMVVDGVVDLWLVLLSLFVCLESKQTKQTTTITATTSRSIG